MISRYGWIRDQPSQEPWLDHKALGAKLGKTPDRTNNRKFVTSSYDQGDESSCTANSDLGAQNYLRTVLKMPKQDLSRQFLYYATRSLEGTVKSDCGASISDTQIAAAKFGVCHEKLWPYSKPFSVKPSAEAYSQALDHQVLVKMPVQQMQEALETVLAAKQPLHYGMTVYRSFESNETARTGIVRMPRRFFDSAVGGHALWLFDYDRIKRLFYGQNSWDPKEWGTDGLCLFSIPYDYILDPDYAADFWTFTKVE